jgi:AsmA family/AsmA-like C-terminal region
LKRLRSKRGIVLGLALLLALFLIRPGAQRLKARIVSSISNALGRPVSVSSASFRFLPRPGFDLDNFVVSDDPQFSAEPMLQAQEVTADLRWSSLLRGRLEIARLSLNNPSLNLVQNAAGHWNLENLLQRAAQSSVAPTGRHVSKPRPAFPYIEADDGRINFKIGEEKKPYALTNADFSLWQDSENSWGLRLEASPVRTDYNLTDTGTIRLSGTWLRASTLRQTPMSFSMQWTGGQLGQATQLIYGNDMGWRGGVRMDAVLNGTPENLRIQTNMAVTGFHRYDLLADEDMSTQCRARYSSLDSALSDVSCQSPVGAGQITVAGAIQHLAAPMEYGLTFVAQQLPMQSVVRLLRTMKKDVPGDLSAEGMLDGKVSLERNGPLSLPVWKGEGELTNLKIQSVFSDTALGLKKVPFEILSGNRSNQDKSESGVVISPRLEIASFRLGSVKMAPAVVNGWFSRSGYDIRIHGGIEVQHLLRIAQTLGIPALQPHANGLANVDLHVAGDWAKFSPPRPVGTVQLHNVRAEIPGMNVPAQIAAATLLFTSSETQVRRISASLAGTTWHGSLTLPRPCSSVSVCPVRFDLSADELSSEELVNWFNPQDAHRPWYRFFYASQARNSFLPALHASGIVRVNRLFTHQIVSTNWSAQVDVNQGIVQLHSLRANVLGGLHIGNWNFDFRHSPYAITGSGSLNHVALRQLAAAMHDGWITGNAIATYQISASGSTLGQLLSSAKANLNLQAEDGWLPHIILTDSGPLRMRRFSSDFLLRQGTFKIENGKLQTPEGIYQVSGTATMGRAIDLKLTRERGQGFSITGTLAEPRVLQTGLPTTRAALKR